MSTLKQSAVGIFYFLAFFGLSSCSKHSQPNFTYMPDMNYSPAVKPQKALMRIPVEGTIPRGYTPYHFTSPEEAGLALKKPVAFNACGPDAWTNDVQYLLQLFVTDLREWGDGSVVPKMPRPPSLQSDKIRGWADGSIFHIITRGQNVMPSYASQITPEDRWAIIHYVRVLQRAHHPTPDDLKAMDAEKD